MQKSRFSRFASIALVAAAALLGACTQIDTGNVGVSKYGGKVSNEEIGQGWTMTWLSTVYEVTTKQVSFSVENLKGKSKDQLTMEDVDVDIYFKMNPAMVAETMTKYQGDMVEARSIDKSGNSDLVVGFNRVNRAGREAVYKAIAMFNATEMHAKRTELAAEIVKILQADLDNGDKGVWIITEANIRAVVPDKQIEESIRIAARRDMEIAAALKEKELANAQAQAVIERAKGEARANEILAASLTPGLIRLREIEAQKAFATQGTHTVLMNSNTGALVNIGK